MLRRPSYRYIVVVTAPTTRTRPWEREEDSRARLRWKTSRQSRGIASSFAYPNVIIMTCYNNNIIIIVTYELCRDRKIKKRLRPEGRMRVKNWSLVQSSNECIEMAPISDSKEVNVYRKSRNVFEKIKSFPFQWRKVCRVHEMFVIIIWNANIDSSII